MKNVFQHSLVPPPTPTFGALGSTFLLSQGLYESLSSSEKNNVFLRVEKVNTLRQ